MVEIIHYERANKNKTIGYLDIKIPILKPTTIVVRRISHVQSGDRKWFNLPAFPRELVGATNYLKYWQFEDESFNTRLLESMKAKVDEYINKHFPSDQQEIDFGPFFGQVEEAPF